MLAGINIIDIIGLILTVTGLFFAIFQTYRARAARLALINEKRAKNAEIWHNIALVLNAYDSIEDARDFAKHSNGDAQVLLAKLSSVRRCLVDQYLSLLKSAVLDEPNFNEERLSRWVQQGRLENEWREKQARKFITDYNENPTN